jgi:multisubunit Na+/H+ antiporter MnhC subunit
MRQGTRYNHLAIASLTLAALAVIGTAVASVAVLAVFAVGAGHVSLNQIETRGERGRGLALTALVIGYGIAALALVSTIYFAAAFSFQQQ